MKLSLPMTAVLIAAAATVPALPTSAAPVPCTGPFVACAIEVQAYCSRDRSGRQRMTYWDGNGNVIRFEQCVARIFAKHGLPNPYTPAGMAAAAHSKLQVPYTELLYPLVEP